MLQKYTERKFLFKLQVGRKKKKMDETQVEIRYQQQYQHFSSKKKVQLIQSRENLKKQIMNNVYDKRKKKERKREREIGGKRKRKSLIICTKVNLNDRAIFRSLLLKARGERMKKRKRKLKRMEVVYRNAMYQKLFFLYFNIYI